MHLGIDKFAEAEELVASAVGMDDEQFAYANRIHELENQMDQAARNLEFEKAAKLRDRIKELQQGQQR